MRRLLERLFIAWMVIGTIVAGGIIAMVFISAVF